MKIKIEIRKEIEIELPQNYINEDNYGIKFLTNEGLWYCENQLKNDEEIVEIYNIEDGDPIYEI